MDKTVINQIKVNVMKKAGLLSLVMFFISFLSVGQIVPQIENCIFCGENILGPTSSAIGDNNTNKGDFSLTIGESNHISESLKTITLIGKDNMAKFKMGSYSIALGLNNLIEADNTYIFGKDNIVSGKYGVAIGLGNDVSGIASVALGSWCKTYKMYGVAIGKGCEADSMSTAIGFQAIALSNNSFAFGKNVKSTAAYSMTLGTGLSSYTYLENQQPYSLMVGFNSDVPTFFVGASSGQSKTGKIGIGNVTSPQAKLHIKGDTYEDADIYLQPGTGYGKIYFGDMEHYIQGKTSYDMVFHSQSNYDFVFSNGNVGIGTSTPESLLDVAGTANVTGATTFGSTVDIIGALSTTGTSLFGNSIEVDGTAFIHHPDYNQIETALTVQSGGEQFKIVDDGDGDYCIIGNDANATYLKTFDNDGTEGAFIFLNKNGNVIIGTPGIQPDYNLTVDGKILAEEIKIQNSVQWYDFVFDEGYDLPKLSDLEGFIKQNKHLPDVPTATEVAENGINLGEMNGILLKKVEELTLYVIEQQKAFEKQQEEIDELKAKIGK